MCRTIFQLGKLSKDRLSCAGILEQSIGARNRVGIGLSYRPTRARICKRLRSPGIDSANLPNLAESIPELLKRLQIRAQGSYAGGIDSWAPYNY